MGVLNYLTLVVLAFASLVAADFPQIVDLGYTKYQGNFNQSANTTNFLSIRYAAPPVGKHCVPRVNHVQN